MKLELEIFAQSSSLVGDESVHQHAGIFLNVRKGFNEISLLVFLGRLWIIFMDFWIKFIFLIKFM